MLYILKAFSFASRNTDPPIPANLNASSIIQSKYYQPFLSAAENGSPPAQVIEPAFVSTSQSDEVADAFIIFNLIHNYDPNYSAVLFTILPQTGVDIDDISYHGTNFCASNPDCDTVQQEVLFKNGLRFKIWNVSLEVIQRPGFPDYRLYNILLEEL